MGPDQIPAVTEVTVRIAPTHTRATPDHTTDALTEALHIAVTQALTVITATHHTEGHLHIEVHLLTPGITADLEHVLHTKKVRPHLLSLHPSGQL